MVNIKPPAYDACGGAVCLDFVNTRTRPEQGPATERLHALEDLLAWSGGGQLLSDKRLRALHRQAKAQPKAAERVFARALELREALHAAFSAVAQGRAVRARDVVILNREWSDAMAHARIASPAEEAHAARRYELTWESGPARLEAPLGPITKSAFELLSSSACGDVKQCGAESCRWLFLDATKNRCRRWCEMSTCGNRAKVRRHRAKQKTQRSPKK